MNKIEFIKNSFHASYQVSKKDLNDVVRKKEYTQLDKQISCKELLIQMEAFVSVSLNCIKNFNVSNDNLSNCSNLSNLGIECNQLKRFINFSTINHPCRYTVFVNYKKDSKRDNILHECNGIVKRLLLYINSITSKLPNFESFMQHSKRNKDEFKDTLDRIKSETIIEWFSSISSINCIVYLIWKFCRRCIELEYD